MHWEAVRLLFFFFNEGHDCRINYNNAFLLSSVVLLDINHASLEKYIKYFAGKYC